MTTENFWTCSNCGEHIAPNDARFRDGSPVHMIGGDICGPLLDADEREASNGNAGDPPNEEGIRRSDPDDGNDAGIPKF